MYSSHWFIKAGLWLTVLSAQVLLSSVQLLASPSVASSPLANCTWTCWSTSFALQCLSSSARPVATYSIALPKKLTPSTAWCPMVWKWCWATSLNSWRSASLCWWQHLLQPWSSSLWLSFMPLSRYISPCPTFKLTTDDFDLLFFSFLNIMWKLD